MALISELVRRVIESRTTSLECFAVTGSLRLTGGALCGLATPGATVSRLRIRGSICLVDKQLKNLPGWLANESGMSGA